MNRQSHFAEISERIGRGDVATSEGRATLMKVFAMVNPLEIMPVLALAVMIACIPIFADPPERRAAQRPVVPRRGPTVPLIALRATYRD